MLRIVTSNQTMKIFYNDGKPWWKTRAKWFIARNQGYILDFKGFTLDIDKLFIKLEGEKDLKPLKEYSTWV